MFKGKKLQHFCKIVTFDKKKIAARNKIEHFLKYFYILQMMKYYKNLIQKNNDLTYRKKKNLLTSRKIV